MKRRSLLAATAMAMWLLIAQTAIGLTLAAQQRLEAIVGRLCLNYKRLNNIYKDLHEVALDFAAGSDQQLSYIQRAYLFVNEANLICFYQPPISTLNWAIQDLIPLNLSTIDLPESK